MTLENALKVALMTLYRHRENKDGELESVFIADFANDGIAGEGVRESVRGYLWDSERQMYFDFSAGLESIKNQAFVVWNENGRETTSLKAYHYLSNKWRVFAQVKHLKEFEE